jgi:hypothetical protein
MSTSPKEKAANHRRTWVRWPPEATAIAHKRKPPAALCEELVALSGYDQRTCWRFLNKHGVRRPGSGSRKKFEPRAIDPLIDYICEHGVKAAALRFGYEPKSLYNFLYRQEHTRLSKDSFSLRQVCTHLGVKHSKASKWIEQGLLKAVRLETKTGRINYSIDFDALRKFCKEHRDLLITRRMSPARLRFLEEYVFAPKHADLLRTRESKREAAAYERGEYSLGDQHRPGSD